MGTIIGIAVGATAAILILAGIILVRCRKRRNRHGQFQDKNIPSTGSQRPKFHRKNSSLSFQCQTHLSPRSPAFQPGTFKAAVIPEEKPCHQYFNTTQPFSVSPVSSMSATSRNSMWPASEKATSRPSNMDLRNITTAKEPTLPGTVHYSTSPKAAMFSSPIEEPTSTTSTKSTAALLPHRPYNPADYDFASPQMGPYSDGGTATNPNSAATESPLLSRAWEQQRGGTVPTWDLPLPLRTTGSRPAFGAAVDRATGLLNQRNNNGRRVTSFGNGSPVESSTINTNFAAPPTRR
jgi:hypothetical protein